MAFNPYGSDSVPQSASQGGFNPNGSADINQYVQYYNNLVQANGGNTGWGAAQDLSGINRVQDAGIGGFSPAQNQWDASRGTRDMSTVDKFFNAVGNIGETIAGAGGFNGWDSDASVAENAGRFLVSLPTGMASAPFSGAASIYEGLSGNAITEANAATGQMPGDELTGFQRAGAIGTGLVDTLGLFLGGSAEALNAGRNILRTARGAEAAGPVGLAASKFMGRGAGAIAVDTLEEGAEEAFQSVMEDIRNDQLDSGSIGRALESAAYGAAGGAIMSAGGQGINSALGAGNATTSSEKTNLEQSNILEWQKNPDRYFDTSAITGTAQQYALDMQNKNRDVPAGATELLISQYNNSQYHSVNDAAVGLNYFDGAWASNTPGSREALAAMLGTTTSELSNVMNTSDPAKRLAGIQNLLTDDSYIVINRTPSAYPLPYSSLKLNLREVFAGNGLSVHPAVQKAVNGDQDGDNIMVYAAGNDAPSSRYYTEQLEDMARHTSAMNGDYFAFMHNKQNTRNALDDFAARAFGTSVDESVLALNEELLEAINESTRDNMDKVTTVLNKYRDFIAQRERDTLSQSGIDENAANAMAEKNAANNIALLLQVLDDTASSAIESASTNMVSLAVKRANSEATVLGSTMITEGAIKKSSADTDFEAELGKLFTSLMTGGHPIFRQEGAWYYPTHEASKVRAEFIDVLRNENVFRTFIARCYEMQDVGCDVEKAVAGYYSLIAASDILHHTGFKNIDLHDERKIQDFIAATEESINNMVKQYNNAISTTGDETTDPSQKTVLPQFKDAKPKDTVSFSGDRNAFAKEFLNIFGYVRIGDIFSIDDRIGDLTFNGAMDLLSYAHDDPWMTGSAMKPLWDVLKQAYHGTNVQVGTKIDNDLGAVFSSIKYIGDLGSFAIASQEDIRSLPPDVSQLIMTTTDVIVKIIGPEAAWALKVADPYGLLNSTWGKAIFSGDERRFRNAIKSLLLTAKYQTSGFIKAEKQIALFEAIAKYRDGEIPMAIADSYIRKALSARRSDSAITEFLYQQYEIGGLDVLELHLSMFTDIDADEGKQLELLSTILGHDATIGDLWAALFNSAEEKYGLSPVTQRLTKAKAQMNLAVNQSGEFIRDQLDLIQQNIDSSAKTKWTKESVVGALKAMMHEGSTKISISTLASVAHSSFRIAKPDTDKGQSRDSASQLQQMLAQTVAGGTISTIGSISYGLDTMSVDGFIANRQEFLNLILTPGSSINLYETITGKNGEQVQVGGTITYEEVYESAGVHLEKGSEANADQFMEMIKTYPQLLSHIVPQHSDPLYSGGESSISTGMERGPVSALTRYLNNDVRDNTKQELKDKITADLLSDIDFFSNLIASTPDAKYMTLAELESAIAKSFDNHVERVLSIIAMDDPAYDAFKTEYQPSNVVSATYTSLTMALDEAAKLSEALTMQNFKSASEAELSRIASNAIIRTLMDRSARDFGLELKDDVYKGLSQEAKSAHDSLVSNIENSVNIFFVLNAMTSRQANLAIASNIVNYAQLYSGDIASAFNGSDADIKNFLKTWGINDDGTVDSNAFISAMGFGEIVDRQFQDHVITFNELKNLPPNDAIAKCNEIVKQYGKDTGVGIDGRISADDEQLIVDAINNGDEDALDTLCLKYNNIILQWLLRREGSIAGKRINENVAYMEMQAHNQDLERIDGLRKWAREKYGSGLASFSVEPDQVSMPFYRFDVPGVAMAATRAREMMLSSPIMAGIAMDASNLNCVGAIGYLSESSDCGVKPDPVKVASLDPNTHSGWKYAFVGSEGDISNVRTLNANVIQDLQLNPDIDQIILYDPNGCLCGGCSRCTTSPGLLGNTVSALISETMENNWLRRKKVFGAIAEIVHSPESYGVNTSYDISSFPEIKEKLIKARSELGRILQERISSELKKLKFTDENYNILASFLTPYAKVTFADGRTEVVSVFDLKDEESFNEKYNQDNAGIVAVSYQTVGLDQASSKIMVGLHNKMKENPDATEKELRDAAFNAYTDWRSYSSGLDVSSVMHRIQYASGSSYAAAYADSIATAPMAFFGDTKDAIYHEVQNKLYPTIPWNNASSVIQKVYNNHSKEIHVAGIDNCIITKIVVNNKDALTRSGLGLSHLSELAASNLDQGSGDVTIEEPGIMGGASRSFQSAEMFINDELSDPKKQQNAAVKAYSEAKRRQHFFVIPESFKEQFEIVLQDDLVKSSATNVMINKRNYVAYDTNLADLLNMRFQTGYVTPLEEIDSSLDLVMQVADFYGAGLADGASVMNPAYVDNYNRTHDSYSTIQVDDLFPSYLNREDPVRVATLDEIKSITNRDIQIDYSFYENKRDLSIEFIKEKTEAYLESLQRGEIYDSHKASNVFTNQVIGFVHKGDKFVPVLYAVSNAPSKADAIEFDIRNGKLWMRMSGTYNIAEDSMKTSPYGLSNKSITTIASDRAIEHWADINDPGFSEYGSNVPVEMMIDGNSFTGRFYGLEGTMLDHNLYNWSVRVGGNLFFDIDRTSLTKDGRFSVKRKDNISPTVTDETLAELMGGTSLTAWHKVIQNKIALFTDEKLNDLVRRVVSSILRNSGSSKTDHIRAVFFTRDIIRDQSGNFIDNKNLNRWGEFASKLWSNFNTDDVLAFYHQMDEKFCPADQYSDDENCMFDRLGYVLRTNATIDDNGTVKASRVPAFFGKLIEMELGGELRGLSTRASFSGQADIQRLLKLNWLEGRNKEVISYLMMRNGDAVQALQDSDTMWEAAGKYNEDNFSSYDEDLENTVALNTSDPVFLQSLRIYRENCLEYVREINTPITIIDDINNKENALNDPKHKNTITSLVNSLNDALGSKNALSFEEVTVLCRLQYGHSFGNSDFRSLTLSQFERTVKMMIESVNKTGLVISPEVFYGAADDIRVGMPLLPVELSRKIYNNSSKLSDTFSTYNDFVEAMMSAFDQTTLPAINRIDNDAKRKALYKMADGIAYTHGRPTASAHLIDGTYLGEVIESIVNFGKRGGSTLDPELFAKYQEASRLNEQRVRDLKKLAWNKNHVERESDIAYGGTLVTKYSTDSNIGEKILRGLVTTRRTIGLMYAEMLPANIAERMFNQGTMSIATHLGMSGIGPYKTNTVLDAQLRNDVSRNEKAVRLWSAMREAQLLGIDRELLERMRNSSDWETVIEKTFKERGAWERYNALIMNALSGKDIAISGQIRLFLDRFCMQIEESAPWWNEPITITTTDGETRTTTLLESTLTTNPAGFFIQVFNGDTTHASVDGQLAAQCMNWALRGDMAQKNLVSAIYAEIAKRHAGVDFFTSAFVSPYFNYMTNRTGRLLQWVAPISSIHLLATKFFSEGGGKNWEVPGTGGLTFGEMMLQDYQLQKDMREAVILDSLHLGPQIIAIMLLGMGALEPPEDEDKWGNFKEWTFFGARVDANWWIEDMLGLAIPYAAFGASCAQGKPRVDLIVNGLAYYLGNNPVTKVADAVEVLFDPMAELYRDYENDVEGYARAMGGPPSMSEMVSGRMTSFGLSFVSQFITPGFLREIYNQGIDDERSYKKIYQEGLYGELTAEGEQGDKVQYTTYQDAIIRKHTRNNPVMGLLADLILRPETGYMAHEMPKTVVYDPYQMNSIEHFSMYVDPYTKTEEKTEVEKQAIAIELIGTLQSKDISQLVAEGFALDYDTKEYVSKYIWDIIASENEIFRQFNESDASNYYYYGDFETGKAIVTEIKNTHYRIVEEWKSLYYDKLWSDELTIAKYHRRHTTYAKDDNGEFYATGYYPQATVGGVVPVPITIAPGESPGPYQTNMGAGQDWQTESIVTGMPTGMRALTPLTEANSAIPSIDSWSTDGTDTGKSDRAANGTSSGSGLPGSGTDANGTGTPATMRTSTRSGSSPRGSRSSSPRRSGGSGGSSAPNIYSRVNAPNISNPDTMRSSRNYDANYDALRPNFETKGSREAYKRSDI